MKPTTHPRISPVSGQDGVARFSVETSMGIRIMTGVELREYLREQMAQVDAFEFRVEILLKGRSVEQRLADLASLGHALLPQPGSAPEAQAEEEEPDVNPDALPGPGTR